MSELTNIRRNRATIRRKLLAGASVLALVSYVSSAELARAEDSDRPQVWLEFGGQLDRLANAEEIYAPPFLALEPAQFSSPLKFERPPLYGIDATAALSFRPEGSDWIFSGSIKYGRSGSNKNFHQQSYPVGYLKYIGTAASTRLPIGAQDIDLTSRHSATDMILDFQVGKDFGLGILGSGGTSTLNLGVRIANFKSNSHTTLHEDPDWHFGFKYVTYLPIFNHAKIPNGEPFHTYAGDLTASRNFRGIGPSLSWQSSTPLAGNTKDGELTLDWGLNAALLFGRQKTHTHHQETAQYHDGHRYGLYSNPATLTTVYQHPATPDKTRSRNVAVPNVGGFAGLSFRYVDAKISVGYKADFFFNAIDGGIDVRKNENRGFYGPFASISFGLGD